MQIFNHPDAVKRIAEEFNVNPKHVDNFIQNAFNGPPINEYKNKMSVIVFTGFGKLKLDYKGVNLREQHLIAQQIKHRWHSRQKQNKEAIKNRNITFITLIW
jgi:hypothetical protein